MPLYSTVVSSHAWCSTQWHTHTKKKMVTWHTFEAGASSGRCLYWEPLIQVWRHKVSETLTSWHSKIWSSWTNRTSSPIRNLNPKNYVENLKIHVFFDMWDPIQSFSRTLSDIIISHTLQKLPNKWGDGWHVTFWTPPCNAAWYECSSPRCYKLQINIEEIRLLETDCS